MNLRELRERLGKLAEQQRAILDGAAGRPRLNVQEQTLFDKLDAEIDGIEESITRTEKLEGRERELGETLNPHRAGKNGGGDGGPGNGRSDTRVGRVLGWTREGREVLALARNERLADLYPAQRPDEGQAQLGRLIRAQVTGDWAGVPQAQRDALSGSSTVGGGILLSPEHSATIIDLARNKTQVVAAGALTVPMHEREMVIAKVASDPTATWRPENASIPVGDMAMEGAYLQAKTVAVILQASVELYEDARNLGQLMVNTLGEVLGLALDRVALVGSGSAEEPMGLQNWPGVQTITSVGTPSDYSKFSDAAFKVQNVNGTASSLILAPRTLNTLDKLEDSTGQPLQPPPSWGTLTKFPSNQVPVNLGGGGAESLAFAGDFSNLSIGIRTEVTIEATRVGAAGVVGGAETSAFRNLQVLIRAYLRADTVVVRPNHFVVMSGITA